MKRLFILPVTILLTTVLGGSLSSGTFAQTSGTSKQTSPTPNGTEVPVEAKQKDSRSKDSLNIDKNEVPVEAEQQNFPTKDKNEAPVDPEQEDFPNSNGTKVPTLPEEKTSPINDGTETPVESEGQDFPTSDETKTPATPQARQGAYVGIQMILLTPEIAQKFNDDPSSKLKVSETQGILVVKVFPNSPAENAGLRRGDIIKEISGKTTTDPEEVIQIVNDRDIGESLPLKVMRGNETDSISIRLGEKPAEEAEN